MIDWFAFQAAATTPGAFVDKNGPFPPLAEELTEQQAMGCRALIDEFQRQGLRDLRWLAAMLGHVFHETGGKMEPVSEDLTEAAKQPYGVWVAPAGDVVQYLVEMTGRPSGIPVPVTRPIEEGKTTLPKGETAVSYYGRGYLPRHTVSRRIYVWLSQDGLDLASDPDVLLDPEIAARVVVDGMMKGRFSGMGLERFFATEEKPLPNGLVSDWFATRMVLGGDEHADVIAATAKGFHKVLLAASS